MKKDIIVKKVEDVGVAVVQEVNELSEVEWNVYLINNKTEELEVVLISSKGYGEVEGKILKTNEFKRSLGNVKPKSFQKIEPIMEDVFALNNEYFLTFFQGTDMFDRKYVFLSGIINKDNLVNVPLINKPGILIM